MLHKPDWREMLKRAKNDRWLYEEIQLVHNAWETLLIEAERLPEEVTAARLQEEAAALASPAPKAQRRRKGKRAAHV